MRTTLFVAALAVALPAAAQTPPALTADDYARAEKFLGENVNPLVIGASVRPVWLADGRFWYRNTIAAGSEFVLVDPVAKRRAPAFDHARIANALGAATGRAYNASDLPFSRFDLSADGRSFDVSVESRLYTCDVQGTRCASSGPPPEGGRNAAPSPDGRLEAFIRDYNLWVRNVQTGQETQLTNDGQKDFGYATDNAGWTKSDRTIVLWSPDSKKIATYQQDERNVGMMYLVSTAVGHPTLEAWKYPLPGDSVIQMIHRVIIDLDGPRVIRLKMAPDAHRSTLCDHIVCRGEWADVEWFPDGSHLAFVSTTRDHRKATLRVADAATGDVRDVYEETVATQYESGYGRVNWHVMPKTNEFIWFSERDDWGHLYLYDLTTGKLKNRITTGTGPVLQMLRVDEDRRTLWFLGAGREAGRDPYFRHFYRIGFDGKNYRLLTPEDADHEISLSPDGRFFVDSYSTPVAPQQTVLRDADGRMVLAIEKADISRLLATGWTPPVPFTVKARDGRTDLYGLMYLPAAFDSTKSYPIVNYVYPGPQTGSVGSRSFAAARGDKRAMAELGFIVVEVDAMGTPMRSKSFHDAYYGDMGDNGLPDQIGAIRQLAAQHSWLDIDHVGIWGHSGGGFATADAMLRYPDFYKVGVSQAGNHDNRTYEDDWGERYQGLLTRASDGSTNYDDQANQTHAANLKGKLLIAHGTMDDNVPPNNTMMLVNELIRNNMDFDLIMMPNRRHGFAAEPYMTRRRWDYFVRWLMGAEPPKGYEIGRKTATE